MKVIVVGGGAAGMMAAYRSALMGYETILIEKNNKLGKKLFLTGKGRCNLTNACDMEELFRNIVSNEKFMYSALYELDNNSTITLFNELGLRTKVERGNRVFPESDHSSDVIKALEHALKRLGVSIKLESEVVEVITELIDHDNDDELIINNTNDNKRNTKKNKTRILHSKTIKGVVLRGGERIYSDAVIFATGGKSYPTTGSDGKTFDILKKENIECSELRPALVPFNIKEKFVGEMSGLSLKNVSLKVCSNNKIFYSGFGEMLFTHFGISGPLVLSASSYLSKGKYNENIVAYIDLKPALDEKTLDDRIMRDFADSQNKMIKNAIGGLLPSAMIASVIELSGIDSEKHVNMITRQERKKLVETIKNYPLTVESTRGFDEAIITSGGIKIKEINPSTMESKKIKNLYFAGEMVDVDALTGGFNLQLAWSTGYLAGAIGGKNE